MKVQGTMMVHELVECAPVDTNDMTVMEVAPKEVVSIHHGIVLDVAVSDKIDGVFYVGTVGNDYALYVYTLGNHLSSYWYNLDTHDG